MDYNILCQAHKSETRAVGAVRASELQSTVESGLCRFRVGQLWAICKVSLGS